MIKLNAIRSDKIWGYENWIASTHPNGMQKEFLDFAGNDFPLLVKVIQANEALSVQVHPNDETAARLENCRGKTECWYVLSARKGATLVYGLNDSYTKEELKEAIESNSLEDMLFYADVKAGDFIYIPAGTVHAIGGGIRLLEVQQSSDITYRLYDYGRGRECHVEKGLACIDESSIQAIEPFDKNFDCPYFYMEEIAADGDYEADADGADVVLYFVLEGNGKINGMEAAKEDIFAFKKGETLKTEGTLKLMKIAAKQAV